MLNPRLAVRYAKSILDLSIELGVMENIYADMLWLKSVCKTNKDFVNVLRSPILQPDTKKKVIAAVTDGRVHELTSRFIGLLISKGRESVFPEIIDGFITAYKKNKNIHTIQLTTATPVSEEIKNSIVDQVKKTSSYENVEIEEKVDPKLIGGFVLQIDDLLVDASIAYDLKSVAKQFENNDFIYKIR